MSPRGDRADISSGRAIEPGILPYFLGCAGRDNGSGGSSVHSDA
jgi:hypothetical protein